MIMASYFVQYFLLYITFERFLDCFELQGIEQYNSLIVDYY